MTHDLKTKTLLVAKQVAELLNVGEQRIYLLARLGLIPRIVVGRRQYRFSEDAILKWIEEGGSVTAGGNNDEQHKSRSCQDRLQENIRYTYAG